VTPEAGFQRCAFFSKVAGHLWRSDNIAHGELVLEECDRLENSIILHNVTLFNREDWTDTAVNIVFEKGIITKVLPVLQGIRAFGDVRVVDIEGQYVIPGLADMHSYHLVGPWLGLIAIEDTNE
jgi:adenine deaminase